MNKLPYLAVLIEETQFPIYDFIEWYKDTENLTEKELESMLVMEFWGSVGAAAALGPVGLMAYQAGKHLWNQARSPQSITLTNAINALNELVRLYPNDIRMNQSINILIRRLNGYVKAQTPQQAQPEVPKEKFDNAKTDGQKKMDIGTAKTFGPENAYGPRYRKAVPAVT